MKQFGISETFIGIYDNAFSEKECEILINQFEKSETSPGHSMVGYYPEEKKCMELGCCFDDKSVISNLVNINLVSVCLSTLKNIFS